MLGYDTQYELAEYLKSVAEAEIEVEVARNVLADKNEFEPILAFHRIDYKNQGQITSEALRRFLIEVEVPAMKSDIDNIYKHYDSNNDSQLTYSDFLRLCLPASKPGLREKALTRQHPRYYVSKRIPFRAELGIARVLEREILVNRNLTLKRRRLVERADWDITDAFATVDYEKKGTIDAYALLIYLRRHQIAANYETVLALLRRIDKDNDELLSYPDFVQFFFSTGELDSRPFIELTPKKEVLPERKSAYAKLMYTPDKITSKEHVLRENYHLRGYQSNYDSFRNISMNSEAREIANQTPIKIDLDSHKRSISGPAYSYQQRVQYKTESFMRKLPTLIYEPRTEKFHGTNKTEYFNTDASDEYGYLLSTERQTDHNIDNSFGYSNKNRISTLPLGDDGQPYYHKKSVGIAKQIDNPDSSGNFTTRSDVSTTYGFSPSKNLQHTSISQHVRFDSVDINPASTSHKKHVSMLDYSDATQEIVEFSTKESPQRVENTHDHVTSKLHERSNSKNRQISLMNIKEESPTKSPEHRFFIDVLVKLIELLAELEDYKIALALRKDFVPIVAFKTMIDVLGDNMTKQQRFNDVMKAHGIYLKSCEVAMLFKALDRDADGMIHFKDFESFITPSQIEFITLFENRKHQGSLTHITQDLVLELLLKLCQAETSWQEIKETDLNHNEFSLKEAFRMFDTHAKGFIDMDDLKTLFDKTFPHKFSQRDLDCLFKRLDFDYDQRINYKEFLREFSHK